MRGDPWWSQLARADLPPHLCRTRRAAPETQQVLASSRGRLVRVDFRFPGTMVVGEVLGYRYHRGDRGQFSRATSSA